MSPKKKRKGLVKQEKNKTKQNTTPKALINQKKYPKKNQGSISGKYGNSTKPRCTTHGQSHLLPIRLPPT